MSNRDDLASGRVSGSGSTGTASTLTAPEPGNRTGGARPRCEPVCVHRNVKPRYLRGDEILNIDLAELTKRSFGGCTEKLCEPYYTKGLLNTRERASSPSLRSESIPNVAAASASPQSRVSNLLQAADGVQNLLVFPHRKVLVGTCAKAVSPGYQKPSPSECRRLTQEPSSWNMEYEPEIEAGRDSEALLLVLDSRSRSPEVFSDLRDAATRMARTRLMYGISKDDLVGVVRSGSSITSNNLERQAGGGYEGVEVTLPPVTRSLQAVRDLRDTTEGSRKSNLLDVLDVCGDILCSTAAKRSRTRRVVLFTDGESIIEGLGSREWDELVDNCKLYKELGMRVDLICHCSKEFEERIQDYEDQFADLGDLSVEDCLEKCRCLDKSFLVGVTKATGGVLMSFKEASSLVERPIAKVKRAVAKFRGVLNIGNMIKIPVKRFSYAFEAKHPTGKKVSWDASCKRNLAVPVLVETQKVASAKDDSPLQEEEIVNAYPYGPELVPETTDVDTYAWSIHLPKGLDALGFVVQDSVPQRLFLGHVDVLIAMSGSDGAHRLMRSLVLAMQAENMGILARSVPAAKGGAPRLAYLWPRVEIDRETREISNCFMFIVDIPMREDIREMPFAKLEDVLEQIPDNSHIAMDKLISAMMVDGDEQDAMAEGEGDDDNGDDDDEPFWPPNECNPNLDWFNICIVHRALSGIAGVDFPPLSEWHRKIMDPSRFVREKNRKALEDAIADLKSALPIMPVPRREKKGRKVYRALSGDFASIKDYLPAETQDERQDDERDDNEEIEGSNVPNPHLLDELDDGSSQITDVDTVDVGEQTPVSDLHSLVKKGRFRFAAVSLQVVIRRLIRDVVDDDKAMRCLQALRKTSVEQREPRFFNDFVSSLLGKCSKSDATGNRTSAFFRHVGRRGEIASALEGIVLSEAQNGEDSQTDRDYRAFLSDTTEQIRKVASESKPDRSVSNVSNV